MILTQGRAADFFWDLQLWQLVTLKLFDLQPYIDSIEKSKPHLKIYEEFKRLAAF